MKNKLQELGRMLRESMTTTANFESFVKDLKKKMSRGEELRITIREIDKSGNVEYKFGTKLKEEAIEIQSAENIWKENKDSAGTYISNAVYLVKPDGENFEVTIEKAGSRKPFATLSKADLAKSFTPMRPDQTPDAEGYVQYRDVEEVEAFKYDKDTLKLNTEAMLNKGDFLVRRVNGPDFEYEVKKAKDFEVSYTKK